jgi:8-oxo-dGTP pyrophosphatase MutT (NUDIX family)
VSAARILEIAELDLTLAADVWPFAAAEAERIEAHWRARQAALPRLFNGRVLLLGRHALERRRDGAQILRGSYFETDYAAFLAWRDFGFPDASVCNAFSMAALVGADGAFLLGEMAAHTANAGAIYFPAGTPDPSDVVGGRVELGASASRELQEETGVTPGEVVVSPTWTVVYAPPRIACMKVMRLAEPAEAVKRRIEAFLGREAHPELAAMHIVRSRGDIDARRSPRFVVDFLEFAFAQKLSTE